MKIAYLDRDGTINRDYPDDDWKEIESPEILKDAINGISKLKSLGYEIIIVTNQYIISEGIITTEQYLKFHSQLVKCLRNHDVEILDAFYCPHTDADLCECKKPKTGMIWDSLEKYDDIEIGKSILIGDSVTDMELASRIGIPFFGLNGGDFKAAYESILEVANHLEEQEAVTK